MHPIPHADEPTPAAALDLRLTALAALEARGGPQASHTLLERLLDPAESDTLRKLAGASLVRLVGRAELCRLLSARWPGARGPERVRICEVLASQQDLRCSALLLRGAQDEDREVRTVSLRALVELADAAVSRQLEPLGAHPDPETRVLVGRVLARVGGEPAERVCGALLADPDWQVRREQCIALKEHPVPGLVPTLLALLADPIEVSEVRFKAVEALALSGSPLAVQPLLDALKDPDPNVSSTSAHCLGYLGDPAVIEPLIQYLQARDDSEFAHAGAAISLGWLGDLRAVPALRAALDDDREAVRQWAAEALGRLRDPAALMSLTGALEDPSELVRAAAARALGALGDRRALGPLLERLNEEEYGVRARAATALGLLGDPLAIEGLLRASDPTEHEEVRAQAAVALGRVGLGSVAVGERLLALLNDPGLSVRRGAALAIGSAGSPALLPRLRGMMSARSLLVQDSITWMNLISSRAMLGDSACHEALRRLVASGGDLSSLAAFGLARLRDPRALAVCIHAAHSRRWDLRLQAVQALSDLDDPRGVAALRARLRDRHMDVRDKARAAIERLERG